MKKIFAFVVLLLPVLALAQNDSIVITGQLLNNTRFAMASLSANSGSEATIATGPIEEGRFRIAVPGNAPKGIYRLVYGRDEYRYIDIVLNGEKEVAFTLDVSETAKGYATFTKSAENKTLEAYNEVKGTGYGKAQALRFFLAEYPVKEDKIYRDAQQSLKDVEKALQTQRDAFIVKNKGTIAAEFVKNSPHRFPNPADVQLLQQYWIYEHYWDGVDTGSAQLLNTPLYSDMIIDYLRLYMAISKRYNDEELEAGYKQAVDTMMALFGKNPQTKQFALDFLTGGFKEIGQEAIVQYLDEAYRAQCANENPDAEFEKRMAAYNSLKPGMAAPEIKISQLTLKDIAGERLVVAFWAGWCPHCVKEMPLLNDAITKYSNTSILAISLDDEKEVYEAASAKLGNMMHFCDFKKWDGEAAEKYHVVATPTFFLLDKQRKIIGKYTSVNALLKELDK